MANIIFVHVSDLIINNVDTATATARILTQEGTGINDFGSQTLTVNLKTLGIYCTEIQLNKKIMDQAIQYVTDQGHIQTWTPKYLASGFTLL